MPGAGLLTLFGAFRAGIGGVTAAYPRAIRTEYVKFVGEAFHLSLPQTKIGTIASSAFAQIRSAAKDADAIAIGPGLGINKKTDSLILRVIKKIDVPFVIDASALNTLGTSKKVGSILKKRKSVTVLTPHEGEMAKLAGLRSSEISAQRGRIAKEYAKLWNAIIVLKGYHTVVAAPDGRINVNESGGPALATPGSGDVLAGMASTFVAQNPDHAFEAACVSVYVHGLAGDLAAKELGERSVLATDVIGYLPAALTLAVK